MDFDSADAADHDADVVAVLLQAGQKQLQIKTSQNERTSQAKRIQDLERQVPKIVVCPFICTLCTELNRGTG